MLSSAEEAGPGAAAGIRERYAMEKFELHLHLDCGASYAAVRLLAPDTTLAEYRRDFVVPARCSSLADFLTRPPRVVALMQEPQALGLITEDLFDQLSRTDARGLLGLTLGQRYERLRSCFGWREEDFRDCNRAALAAAFAPEEVKRRVAVRMETGA
jgi:adenosine deaminase